MNHKESINAPGKPEAAGQIVKFVSPQGATLVDVAEMNKYGQLVWVAMAVNDPRYIDVVNGYPSLAAFNQ